MSLDHFGPLSYHGKRLSSTEISRPSSFTLNFSCNVLLCGSTLWIMCPELWHCSRKSTTHTYIRNRITLMSVETPIAVVACSLQFYFQFYCLPLSPTKDFFLIIHCFGRRERTAKWMPILDSFTHLKSILFTESRCHLSTSAKEIFAEARSIADMKKVLE